MRSQSQNTIHRELLGFLTTHWRTQHAVHEHRPRAARPPAPGVAVGAVVGAGSGAEGPGLLDNASCFGFFRIHSVCAGDL